MESWRENKLWKQQKIYIVTTVVVGFFLPLFLFFLNEFLFLSFGVLRYIILPALFFLFVAFKSIEKGDTFWETFKNYCTFVPFDYLEKESLLEKKFNATYALILINVIIHYGTDLFWDREIVASYFSFLPEKLHFWNLIISPISSMFIHGDAEHLWNNVFFLWIFGLVLERRIGWKKFLYVYFFTGLVSALVPTYLSIVLFENWYSAIGASGAISGLIGAFAFRLFYKRMVFPIPVLGLVSILFGLNLKVRMNSLMVIMFYFFFDFAGSLLQLSGMELGVDYLGHLSGMLFGMYLASRMKLHDAAIEEMMLERARTAIDQKGDNQMAEGLLNLLLEKNPDRVEGLILLARLKDRFGPGDEGQKLYLKAIEILINRDVEKAAEVFTEYFGIHRKPLEPAKQYQLTEVLEKTGRASLAARALEMLADDPATSEAWRPRILYRAARILERLEFYEAACYRYEQLLEKYPDFHAAETIRQKLEKLKTVKSELTWMSYVRKKQNNLWEYQDGHSFSIIKGKKGTLS